MRILIPTIGTRGDLQPYIALALRLQGTCQAAIVATHPSMRRLVESYGVEFAPMGPDVDLGQEATAIRGRSRNWILGFMRVMKFSFDMLERSHEDILRLARQADLMIVSHSAAGSIEADQLGLPRASVTFMPQAIPVQDPAQSRLSKLVMKAAGAGMGLIMTRPLNKIRGRLGLAPLGPTGITSPVLNLIPLSEHVVPPNPLWEPRHKMTGYWFAPSPRKWAPLEDLVAFIEAGDPPVVVSLGAMALGGADSLEAAQTTIAAVQQAGVRAVIQGWESALKSLWLPQTIFPAGSIPHDWLLERASSLVHHGGFGTTAAGLRAGIPALVIPHIIDQFLWGQRIFELGVGPRPLPRARLTVDRMAKALVQLHEDSAMRSRARLLGETICKEDGTGNAVRLLLQAFPA